MNSFSGIKISEYVCKNPYNEALDDNCDPNKRPQRVTRQCNMGSCLPVSVSIYNYQILKFKDIDVF